MNRQHNELNTQLIELCDITGSIIKRYNKQEITDSFDLSFLKTGIYFIRIITPQNICVKRLSIIN